MVTLLKDSFLPDVEACDEVGFTDCLLASNDGFDFTNMILMQIFSDMIAPQPTVAKLLKKSIEMLGTKMFSNFKETQVPL